MKNIIFVTLIGISYHLTAQEGIRFDASLTPEQRNTIRNDFDNLCRLDYDFVNEEARRELMPLFAPFGIEELNCEVLTDWLEERIGVITGHLSHIPSVNQWGTWPHKFSPIAFHIHTTQQFYYLINQQGYADRILAVNLGPQLTSWTYDSGEAVPRQPAYFIFDADNGMRIPMLITQKKGLLFTSEAFFDPRTWAQEEPSIVGSLLRLGSLFHTARHSDAYQPDGTFLTSFGNTHCPDGNNTCNDSWAGSYGIQYAFLTLAAEACNRCDRHENDVLRMMAEEIRDTNIIAPLPEVLTMPPLNF